MKMTRDYVHETIDSEVETISGHYSLHKEAQISFGVRRVLYLIGSAVIDRSCCGVGGCLFALVPGYIVSWKYKRNKNGLPVSKVEPISERSAQQEIASILKIKEHVNQVQFL